MVERRILIFILYSYVFFYQFSRPGYQMKWTKASIALFIESNYKYYRSPQRCREVWSYRLNPSVTHSQWTLGEDEILIMQVLRIGKKWA